MDGAFLMLPIKKLMEYYYETKQLEDEFTL